MDDDQAEHLPWYKANLLKIFLVGGLGYLLGSVFPAGYLNYLVRSQLFPETLVQREPPFDRSLLEGAKEVKISDLTSTLDANPSLFESQYLEKPVIFQGRVKYFLDGPLGSDGQTLSVDTGSRYGPSLIVSFDDRKSEDVLSLREGKTMRALCFVTGTTNDSIHMQHCELAQ
jgi:hypothetical protein